MASHLISPRDLILQFFCYFPDLSEKREREREREGRERERTCVSGGLERHQPAAERKTEDAKPCGPLDSLRAFRTFQVLGREEGISHPNDAVACAERHVPEGSGGRSKWTNARVETVVGESRVVS